MNPGREMTHDECEAYVQGLWDLWVLLGGDVHCKSYDPLTFSEDKTVAHSYVLDLGDNGLRHHRYITPDDVAEQALLEFDKEFRTEFQNGFSDNTFFRENINESMAKRRAELTDDDKARLSDTPKQFVVISITRE